MAVFSDTTGTKDGLVQRFEFWTRMKDGAVTGTLLKQVTSRINVAYERIMPILLSNSDYIRWDDKGHGDRPIGTFDIVSGQSDYTIAVDENSLEILNITAVRILTSATATEYEDLNRFKLDDSRVLDAMSPNPSSAGIPDGYVENGNSIFFTPEPNYSVTDGVKIFFQREHDRFASTDTTKTSGIPKIFDELLVLHAAKDWTAVNRTNDASLRNEIRLQIEELERNLKNFIDMRNPTDIKMTMGSVNHR